MTAWHCWSVVAVVGLNMAVSFLSGWLGNAVGMNIHIDIQGNGVGVMGTMLGFFCLGSLVLNLVYFFISRWILMHKLNLE